MRANASQAGGPARRPGASTVWRRFLRGREGTSAVEFGLIAVPFLGLLLAILESGLVFLNSEGLEAAVQDAARNIMTGKAQAASISTAAQFVSTYLCPTTGQRVLPSFVDCSKLIVDVRPAASFSAANLTNTFYRNPATLSFCPGSPGTIIVVRVAYPMTAYLPLIAVTNTGSTQTITSGLVNDVPGNSGWKHLIVGTAVFQTEPFQSSTYTPPAGC